MRTNRFAAGAALTTAILLAGCGGGGGSSTPKVAQSQSQTLPNGLVVSMAVDRTTVRVGGIVTYTLQISNPTSSAISYSIGFDLSARNVAPNTDGGFLVVGADGSTYPPFSTPDFSGSSETLAAGQSFTDTLRLGPSDGVFKTAGTYSATVAYGITGSTGPLGPLVVTAQ